MYEILSKTFNKMKITSVIGITKPDPFFAPPFLRFQQLVLLGILSPLSILEQSLHHQAYAYYTITRYNAHMQNKKRILTGDNTIGKPCCLAV